MSDDAVVLRNYEGMLDPLPGGGQAAATGQPTNTRGVSGLLQGDKTALIPHDNERMARRRPRVAPETCGGDSADANTDGGALRPIIPLPMLSNNGNGHAAQNG